MTLDEWLKPRLVAAPPELAAAIRELLVEAGVDGADPASDASEGLAAAALRGIDEVARGDAAPERPVRGPALRLLAADAALTYAFEAAADLGTDVVALAERLGPRGALGARLSGRSSAADGARGDEATSKRGS
ncbi:MAG: hypothetical protein PVF05_06445 [Gemmatimonadales bacterium]